jgi:two-component system cell cycle response regulator CtrA
MVCLLAFMAHFYSPTIEMRTHFDKAIDLADTLALIFLAPLLIHFAAIYPSRYSLFRERRWAALGCYGPAVLLMTIELLLRFTPLRAFLIFPAVNLRSGLNRIELLFFSISLIASALLFIRTFRAARSIVVRQQLKWVMWGMSIAATTFALFYLPSFLAVQSVASVLTLTALAPLILVPVTLGYSIVRYRLMDVDVVMRRSFAYIVATLSVAALFGSVMAISYEVLRSLRVAKVKTPILILSGLAGIEDKVRGLGFGADDYLTKPFHKDELVARIHAIVRRSKGHAQSVITTGDLIVNLDTKTVEVDAQRVHLTGKEYQMLELLSLRKGTTLTKEMFLNHLYGGMDEPELKIIDVFICKLRKKLANASDGKNYIETVWGRGYVLREPSDVEERITA